MIRPLNEQDPERIAEAFASLGWNKSVEQYERFLVEQAAGLRAVLVAEVDGSFAGYVTLVWRSPYPPFRERGVPEIRDLNVLPAFRRRGIGTALMETVESFAGERCSVVGTGVGMDRDYGPAQAMYVRRGYVPDARSLTTHGAHVALGGHREGRRRTGALLHEGTPELGDVVVDLASTTPMALPNRQCACGERPRWGIAESTRVA